MKTGRKTAALTLALILAISCVSAIAEGGSSAPAAQSETVAKLLNILDFKFFIRDEGIGKGSAPVYTAPDENSLRLNDGKASCSVESEIAVAGFEDGWLLVRYEIGRKDEKDRKVRVGYIPPAYARKYKSGRGDIEFDSFSVTLEADTEITDNPRHNSTPFGTLPAGLEITILAKYTYTGNWWYVEAVDGGTKMRGFINRSETGIIIDGVTYHGNAELGFPVKSPENTAQNGMVTISGNEEEAVIVRKGVGSDTTMVARVYGGDSFPCYGFQTLSNGKTWYYIWVDGVWGWVTGGLSAFIE